MPINGLGLPCLQFCWLRNHFLFVARSDHTARSRNIKPKVVFKVQKMARYASFCLIMGPFKGEMPVFARLWPVRVRVRVRVSFTTGAVWSAILATVGLLVPLHMDLCKQYCRKVRRVGAVTMLVIYECYSTTVAPVRTTRASTHVVLSIIKPFNIEPITVISSAASRPRAISDLNDV